MIAAQQIKKAQEDKGWKTSADVPLWQVNYNSYGGFENYIKIRGLYWGISGYYLYVGTKYTATNFPLVKASSEFKDLLEKFRRDLKVELDIPEKYDKYR